MRDIFGGPLSWT